MQLPSQPAPLFQGRRATSLRSQPRISHRHRSLIGQRGAKRQLRLTRAGQAGRQIHPEYPLSLIHI